MYSPKVPSTHPYWQIGDCNLVCRMGHGWLMLWWSCHLSWLLLMCIIWWGTLTTTIDVAMTTTSRIFLDAPLSIQATGLYLILVSSFLSMVMFDEKRREKEWETEEGEWQIKISQKRDESGAKWDGYNESIATAKAAKYAMPEAYWVGKMHLPTLHYGIVQWLGQQIWQGHQFWSTQCCNKHQYGGLFLGGWDIAIHGTNITSTIKKFFAMAVTTSGVKWFLFKNTNKVRESARQFASTQLSKLSAFPVSKLSMGRSGKTGPNVQ